MHGNTDGQVEREEPREVHSIPKDLPEELLSEEKNIMKKTATIAYGSVKAYAQVKDRLKEFRSDCPNALIETYPTITDTHIIFKARILKDKGDPASAEATGHSMGVVAGDKGKIFEKQETIAVGRALALLGYASDGEIASSDEMEEFQAHRQEQLAEAIMEVTEAIGNCGTQEELKKYWGSLSGEMKKLALEAKDAKKAELSKVKDIQ